MSNKLFWKLLILFASIATLYQLGTASLQTMQKLLLTEKTTGNYLHIKSKQIGLNAYAPEVHFSYKVSEKEFSGKGTLTLRAANPEYIQEKIPELKKKQLQVFYDPSAPEDNALNRDIPFGKLLKSAFLVGLTLYLIILSKRAS